jgi:uncharacterized membrane protein YhhN
MTSAAALLLGLAAAAALADWWAVSGRARGRRAQIELFAKPAVLAALIGVAATLHPIDSTTRGWFLAALACCLIGDVALMLDSFELGLGGFLIAHVLFLVGLAEANAGTASTLVALVVLVAVAAAPATLVIRALWAGTTGTTGTTGTAGTTGTTGTAGANHGNRERALVAPVVIYMLALLTMAAAGWSAGLNAHPFGRNAWLCVGVTLFVVSDTLLALDRFVKPLPYGKLVVHATYHLAVGAIVISLAAALPS